MFRDRISGPRDTRRQQLDQITAPWSVAEAIAKSLANMLRALLMLFFRGSTAAIQFARDHVVPAAKNAAFAPLTLAARGLTKVSNAFCRAPAAAVETTAEEQANQARQRAAAAQRAETRRVVAATDTAVLLRRVATRRARGADIPEALLARLPAPLRRYVEALDEDALKALAQASVDDIAAWLSNKGNRIPGVPTLEEAAAVQRKRAPVGTTLSEHFAQRVRNRLCERNQEIVGRDNDIQVSPSLGIGR